VTIDGDVGKPDGLILLTGATGYVGGRLLLALEGTGRRVRCLARRPEYLRDRVSEGTEVAAGDVLDVDTLPSVLAGVEVAYYLVHSMGARGDFVEQDRLAATNFAQAAKAAGVRRIVYLGGLGRSEGGLSAHLRSRQEVGDILRTSGALVIELRASVVIGSGSLSFEMIRALVERLPVMVTPRWVSVPAQPIYIDDLLAYLVAALELDVPENRVFEIGGADRVSYGDLMREYARQRGLRRLMIPLPVLTPRLSSLWLGLVTPLYARVGRKLIDSIRHPTVIEDPSAHEAFGVRPRGVRDAIASALQKEDQELAGTRWSDALSSAGVERRWSGVRFGSRIVDSRQIHVNASAEQAFEPIERIGGQTGWYYGNWLWRLRGFIDLLLGGVGMRRGRSDPDHLRVGDTLDCWRVEDIVPNRRLRLQAEMKLPGRAWLEFEVVPDGTGGSTVRQTALFDPVGIAGRAYWLAFYAPHALIFSGMLRRIAAACVMRPASRLAAKSAGWVSLLVFTALVFGLGSIGAVATNPSLASDWYASLAKPTWTPPGWIFGPVWSLLYLAMALAAWLVWRRRRVARTRLALSLFWLQLTLNIAWSPLFFGLQRPGLALLDIVLLWLAIVLTALWFWRVTRAAGALMLPYLLWVTFATALNFAIYRLNV